MALRRTVLTAAGTALSTALAGCTTDALMDSDESEEGSATPEPTTTARTTTPPPKVDLVRHGLVRRNADTADELVKVVGVIENVTDEPLSKVDVVAAFRAGNGSLLAEVAADLSDMTAGNRWRFELYFPGSGEDARAVADYRLDVDVMV